MRTREHLGNSQHIQEVDGSRGRRNLTPIEIGIIGAEVAVAIPFAVWADIKISPREQFVTVGKAARMAVSKKYREQVREEERKIREDSPFNSSQ